MDSVYGLLKKAALFLALALVITVPGRAQFQLIVSSTTVNLSDNQARSIQVTAPGTTALAYTVSGEPFWLSAFSSNGFKTPDTLSFQIMNTNCGSCTATITLVPAAPPGIEAPVVPTLVKVTYAPGGTITASQYSFQFTYPSNTLSAVVTIGSNNPSVISFNLNVVSQSNWLQVGSTDQGAGSYGSVAFGTYPLSVNTGVASTLETGIYTGTLTLINPRNSNDITTINLTLMVNSGTGSGGPLNVNPAALTFTALPGGPSQSQSVTVNAASNASVTLNATSFNTPAFFSISSPACSGTPNLTFSCTFTGTQTLTITVNPANLATLGTYAGSLQLQSGSAAVTVYLSLNLTTPVTTLTVNPTSLAFTAAAGSVAQSRSVTVAVPGSAFTQASITSLNGNFFSVTSTGCSASPTTAPTCFFSGNQTLLVTVNPANLTTPGVYNGNVLLQSGGWSINVPVSLTLISAGTVIAAPDSLAFAYQIGSAAFVPQQVITVGPVGTFTATAGVATTQQWLVVNAVGSTGPGYVIVSVSPQGLAAGAYAGTVTINSASGIMAIPVTLTVTASVVVEAGPGNVYSQYQAGSPPIQQGITLSASDNSPTPVTASTATPWITVGAQSSPVTPASFTLTMNPAGLCNGLSTGSVSVSAPNATNNGFTIPVVVLVSGSTVTTGCPNGGSPPLMFSPPAMLFAAPVNGPLPLIQNLTVTAPAPTTTYTVSANVQGGVPNWLTVLPSGALSGSQPLVVSVNQTGLAVGTYTATISFNLNGMVQTVPVTLVVTPPVGVGLAANPSTLTFSADSGRSAGSQNVTLSTISSTPINIVNISTDSPNFLSAAVSSGSFSVSSASPATVTVSATAARLPFGSITGHITVTPSIGPPVTIAVTINVGTGIRTGAVVASPPSLTFIAPSGQTPAPQTVSLTAGSPVAIAIATDVSWLSFGVASLTVSSNSPTILSVTASAASLQAGFYVGHLTITPSAGTATVLPVTFLVPPASATGTVTASQTSFQFAFPGATLASAVTIGTSNPTLTSFNVTIASQSNWLLLNAASAGTYTGVQFGPYTIMVNYAVAATLPAGTYSGTITLINPQNPTDTTTINSTLTVSPGPNLARGRSATQSSTLPGYATDSAASAVDGITDGNFFDGSVSHTNQDPNAWWQVDLGASANVTSVVVWSRTDCCSSRLSDYWVFISDTPFLASDTPTTLQGRLGTFASHQTVAPNPSTTIAIPGGAQGRYVRVQLTGTDYLSLAEVQVMGTGGGPATANLAQGKIASQSSTLPGYATDGPASAVDGITDGNFFDGSMSHTNADPNSWWQVDLGASASVTSVVVWNRTDCCSSRLSDYWVFISDTPFLASDTPATLQGRLGTFASHQTSIPNPSTTIAIPGGAQGRYVRVQLSGTDYLSLAEVQVFGTGGTTTPANVARGKLATQSSTYPGYATAGASAAVDGTTDGNFSDGSVTHTNQDPKSWWQVDLGASTAVSSIVIWNRTDCCGSRLNDYWVFVSDTPFGATDTPTTLSTRAGTFASHQTLIPNPSATIAIPGGAQGRYVRVQLSGANYLSLAEVQVFGQ